LSALIDIALIDIALIDIALIDIVLIPHSALWTRDARIFHS